MADDNKSVDSDEEVNEIEEEKVEEPQEDTSLNNPDVVTKYQEAAKIAQAVLLELIPRIIPGAKLVELCKFADELIEQKVSQIFKNKGKNGKVPLKGIAFPLCLSVNEIVCHVSPLESESAYPDLVEGDLVKIDLGVHIDGFIAVVAHTVAVGIPEPTSFTPEQIAARSNVMNAAYTAAEVAVRTLKPGNTNHQVTAAIKQVADAFGVNPISGTLMHQMKQYVIDGNKMILLKEEPDQKVDTATFEAGEVYAIDIAFSTGDGKPRETGNRTTIFKRAVDRKYALKNKSSRIFFNEVNKRFPTLPFTLRSFADEKAARLGVRECVTHELLLPYPILQERREDFIAHAKVTVLLLPSGNTAQITGLAPFTYVQAVEAQQGLKGGDAEGDALTPAEISTKVSAALPIGLTFSQQLKAQKGVELPAELMELLSQKPAESKKKNKKSKKSTTTST